MGAGPAGLITALQLAENGIKCMLVERNLDTTKWPKMDITNCRSMELFRRLKIDKGLREVGMSSYMQGTAIENFRAHAANPALGVPQHYSFDVHISSGLSDGGEQIAKWVSLAPSNVTVSTLLFVPA